ncbi:MAG: PqiC family protein [Candidatus Omnitrophota bacterium]
MKKSSLLYGMVTAALVFSLALGGCISIPKSPNPRFYTLSATAKGDVTGKADIPPDVIIGIGPVKIPEYLNRPQIVTQDKKKMLNFAEFDRWGEQLDFGINRLIYENLAVLLPGATTEMFPWNLLIPVKYQVVVNVIRLDSELDKDLSFVAQCSVLDLESKQMVFTKRVQIRQPIVPQSYPGLVQALNVVVTSLSKDIAEELVSLANQDTKKGEASAQN